MEINLGFVECILDIAEYSLGIVECILDIF
jgi:hypothetical protein